MLHAYMLSQSGIPVIYSGDEIGQENDYTYHENPKNGMIPDICTGAVSVGILRRNAP